MMKKLLTLSLFLVSVSALADTSLTVNTVKADGSMISSTVKFTATDLQQEVDGMLFEVTTQPDEDANFAMLDLKISRKNSGGEMVVMCSGNGKVALNKEEVVEMIEKNGDDVMQTITLTFVVSE